MIFKEWKHVVTLLQMSLSVAYFSSPPPRDTFTRFLGNANCFDDLVQFKLLPVCLFGKVQYSLVFLKDLT